MRKLSLLTAVIGVVFALCGMPAAAQETDAAADTAAQTETAAEESADAALVLQESADAAVDTAAQTEIAAEESADAAWILQESADAAHAAVPGQEGAVSSETASSESDGTRTTWAEKTAILDAVSVGEAYLQGGMQELADGLAIAMENQGGTGLAELVSYSRSAQVYYQAAVNSLSYAIELCGDREDTAFLRNPLIIYRNILSAFLLEPEITEDNVIDYPDDDYMDHGAELAAFLTDVSRLWVEMEPLPLPRGADAE